jgi:arabinogalactan endo-1,4-beta-galactosidase
MNSQRSQLRWAAILAVAIHGFAPCGFADLAGLPVRGGDISELPRLEHYGARYFDDGVQNDCLEILKRRGVNLVRLRLYNDPGNANHHPARLLDPLGWQNPERALALARRAKALGLQIQLTFHYSDYWSNPGVQHKPHDWEGQDFPRLCESLTAFTTHFLGRMVAQGTPPEFVSLGNEIQGGILFPDGASSNFSQLAELLKHAGRAVRSASPGSRMVLHVSDPRTNTANWFFDRCVAEGVAWDVTGVSYYPFWSKLAVADLAPHLGQLHRRFGKPVLIMETGYNWSANSCDGQRGQLKDNGPEGFPSTPQGQKEFLRECFKAVRAVPDGGCLGLIYWDPIFICVQGQGWQNGARNVVANTALFDFGGHALPALEAFRSNE